MAEPWSIVSNHPITGEPFGLVMNDDSTFTQAEDIGLQLLATFELTGLYIQTSSDHKKHGHYLFNYLVSDHDEPRLATIWADCYDDALLRLNTLAADGILLFLHSS
jgi:hypothetical protein